MQMDSRIRVEPGTVLALSLSILLWTAPTSGGTFILSAGEAGPVKAGMTIDRLSATVGDSAHLDENLEGLFSPAIEVYFGQPRAK